MSQEAATLTQRVLELRQAFDHSFSEAPAGESALTEAFLAITVGGDNYALRLAEISGLYVDKKVTHMPSRANDLLGLASFRGALVPVYDLRVLLGYPAGTVPRWLAMVASQTPVALAFDHFDGHLRLPRDAVAHESGMQHEQQHVGEALRTAGLVRLVVSVASILESIKKRAQSSVP